MEQGWIKLHRSIFNHWLWKEDTKLKWWLDLLLMANHTTRKILLGNNLIEIPRGSLHTSVTKLAARWQSDKKTVKRFLDLLQKDSMISYSATPQGTTINISNYKDFQDFKGAESLGEAPAPSPTEATAASIPTDSLKNTEETRILSTPGLQKNPQSMSPPLSTDSDMDDTRLRDNPWDIPLPTPRNKGKNSSWNVSMENCKATVRDTTKDNTKDTNNNVNNKNNLNNAKNGEEGKECEEGISKVPPLSFPTHFHEEIHSTLGEIAYRTWFMDATIASTPKVTTLQVDSDFKRDVINTKFRVQLGRILGKIVEVKSA